MQISKYKDFTDRFVYLKDEGIYYDKTQRVRVPTDAIRIKALKYFRDMPLQEIDTLLQTLSDLGIRSEDLNKGRPTKTKGIRPLLDTAYKTLSKTLPIYRHMDESSVRAYTKDKYGQFTLVGDLDEQFFSSFIMNKSTELEAFQGLYQSEEYMEIRLRIDFNDFVSEMYNRFLFDPSHLLKEEPAILSWSPSVPAFRVLDPLKIVEGPHPAWDEFTARMTFGETFKAFLWSVFEPDNRGRQALWLRGDGGDGKSTAIRAITNYLGTEHTLTIGLGTYDNDFFFGFAYGKRLAIYPDCKNLSVLRKERIKQLLGNDIVPINAKYRKQFSARVFSRLIIASNWLPQINVLDDSERTRLLVCEVKSYEDEFGDPDFEYKLEAEMNHFLYTCREAYKRECPTGMNLRVPLEMRQLIQVSCSATDADVLDNFIQECLEFGPEFKLNRTDLYKALRSYFMDNYMGKESSFSFNDLQRILSKRGIKLASDNSKFYIGVGLKHKTVKGTTNGR